MKSPLPSTHDFQTKSFIKRTCGGDDANAGGGAEGGQTPTSSSWKIDSRVLTINSKPLLMTNLEMKLNQLYESICMKFEGSHIVP